MTPTHVVLNADQIDRIRRALKEALPTGLGAEFDAGNITERRGDFQVPIQPTAYPEAMYEFMEGLAKAEIALRDSGFPVRLLPDVQQRFLVVAYQRGGGNGIAYLSTDGAEQADLARNFGVSRESIQAYQFVGYPYDSPQDLREAIEEAKAENPEADFSRVAAA